MNSRDRQNALVALRPHGRPWNVSSITLSAGSAIGGPQKKVMFLLGITQ